MSYGFRYAARSVVGLVRSSNQDSAYASPNMLVVADGMGGHAGGDVASAIAIEILKHLDHPNHSPRTALNHLQSALDHSQAALVRASESAPQLQGLGTTVVCLLRTDTTLVMAHLGDSRAYLLRGGELHQVTTDHTFVQHLVDTGRITPDEAEVHPQRNVVMRVLSDFDLNLPPDVSVREAKMGDRWLLCSDGLSGFMSPEQMAKILAANQDPAQAAEDLIKRALDNQSTDNVTCLVADIVEVADATSASRPEIVGAAADGGPLPDLVKAVVAGEEWDDDNDDDAQPMSLADLQKAGLNWDGDEAPTAPEGLPVVTSAPLASTAELPIVSSSPSLAPVPITSAAVIATVTNGVATATATGATSGATPRVDPLYFSDDDDPHAKPPSRRRPWIAAVVSVLAVLALVFGLWRAYSWTQQQYFVGVSAGQVAVFRGVSQSLGPINLSTPVQVFPAYVDDLPTLFAQRLNDTIPASSYEDAIERAERLLTEAQPQHLTNTPPLQTGPSSTTSSTGG